MDITMTSRISSMFYRQEEIACPCTENALEILFGSFLRITANNTR